MENIFEIIFHYVGSEVVGLSMFSGALTYVIVSVLKDNYSINKNHIPLIAVCIGLLLSVLAYVFIDITLTERIWAGFIGGFVSISAEEILSVRGNEDGKEDESIGVGGDEGERD